MTKGPMIWALGLLVSLGLHAFAAVVLAFATQPGDIPDQPTPETSLELATYQVERTEAKETAPESEQAASSETGGTSLGQNEIATSRADALDPSAARLDETRPTGERLASAVPDVEALVSIPDYAAIQALTDMSLTNETQTLSDISISSEIEAVANVSIAEETEAVVNLPVATDSPEIANLSDAAENVAQQTISSASIASLNVAPENALAVEFQSVEAVISTAVAASDVPIVTPAAIVIETATAKPQIASAELLQSSALIPVVEPAQAVLAAALTVPSSPNVALVANQVQQVVALSADIKPQAPRPQAIAQQPTQAEIAASVQPQQTHATATLAFPGTGDGPVDPVSLSAFQSFMQPNDVTGAAAEVRDGITGALSAIPCSRVQARFDPADNSLILTGHVPEDALRGSVLTAMKEQMGTDIPVKEDLLILPSPQCGALTGIADVGLPQSTDQITNPLLLGENTHASEFRYVDGQALVLNLQGADYDAYVYVDYFDADGNVLHLAPNEFTPLEATVAKSALQIGSDHVLKEGEPGLHIKIGPPFGQEIAVAFASSVPLFDGTRPLVEPAEPYLIWLKDRVSDAREEYPDFKGEWVYFFVSTAAN